MSSTSLLSSIYSFRAETKRYSSLPRAESFVAVVLIGVVLYLLPFKIYLGLPPFLVGV